MKIKTLHSTSLMLALGLSITWGIVAAELEKSLYDRWGGQPAVQAETNGLIDRILVDGRINSWFAEAAASPANAAAYPTKLYEFVCQNTGGPCKYSRRDM